MLRKCAVGWGGVGMMTFFELEHMVDATQLCLSYHCTHGGCYATVRWVGVGWGGDDANNPDAERARPTTRNVV